MSPIELTPEQNELFRKGILRVLDSNRTRFGLGILPISHHLAIYGFTAKTFGGEKEFHQAVEAALEYLAEKRLLGEAQKEISRENRAWKISVKGMAFVDEQG